MNEFCLSDSKLPSKNRISLELIALVILVVSIVIVFQAILCMLWCSPKKEFSDTHNTLVAGKQSVPMSPDQSGAPQVNQ